jgi:hypothetical protein
VWGAVCAGSCAACACAAAPGTSLAVLCSPLSLAPCCTSFSASSCTNYNMRDSNVSNCVKTTSNTLQRL